MIEIPRCVHRVAAGLTTAFLLLSGCASGRTAPQSVAALGCREVLARGVFNEESLACFPRLAAEVANRLCEAGFETHAQANLAGFGYGSLVFSDRLIDPRSEVRGFDRSAVAAWKSEHCASRGAGRAVDRPQQLAWWGDLYRKLPMSLAGPWLACSRAMHGAGTRGVRCILEGAYDVTGENGDVVFSAWNIPDAWLDAGARLRSDLVVEGADCGNEAWQEGSRIPSTSARILTCRRRARSAVRVQLDTGEGTCVRTLPALTEPPWRELCHSTTASTSAAGPPAETAISR